MANEILSSTTASDQEKFLAARLIQRSALKLVAASVCDPEKQPEGAGFNAYFVRYQRMNVPLVALSEGQNPSNSSFTLGTAQCTMSQWGDVLTITDLAQMTTKHPLVQQAIELLSDNAQRVIDREIQLVWMAGTNVQYGDGSVTARKDIANTMTAANALVQKARVTLADAGAPGRGGPSGLLLGNVGGAGSQAIPKGSGTSGLGNASGDSLQQGALYVGIFPVQVVADVMAAGTSLGTWASTAMYANQKQLYNAELGTWLGIRWVESNFLPKITLLGNNTAAVVSTNAFGTDTPVVTAAQGGSGTLAQGTTYYFKVTRKDLTRGFEEAISIRHSMASTGAGGATQYFTFNFGSLTAGYVYNLYFGDADTDAACKLHTANIAVDTTVTVNAISASTTTAPQNGKTDGTKVYVGFIHGASSCSYVTFQNLQVILSADIATPDNPLKLRRTIGYKFAAAAMIRDQTRLLRVEMAATT